MQAPETAPAASQLPRVSVVMPVFNAAAFLEESITSVIEQTEGNWELILVDDGSSDESPHLCAKYARTHANIRVVSQTNTGPSAARNAGVTIARGDYIFFLDADDRIPPDALHHLLSAAAANHADMVLGNFLKQENDSPPHPQPVVFSPDGEPFQGDTRILSEGALVDYVRHFLNHPSNHLVSYCWARLYRRALIVQHNLRADENMRLFEDFAFNLAFLGKAKRLIFVNQPVYVYVLRSHHMSASMSILDARSLASDMQSFRRVIDTFMTELSVAKVLSAQVRLEVGHTLVHYAVIFIIRSCRQLAPETQARIYSQLRAFLSAPVLQESLSNYRPRQDNSRLLPILMKLKLVRLLAVMAKRKGDQRYGKLENTNS